MIGGIVYCGRFYVVVCSSFIVLSDFFPLMSLQENHNPLITYRPRLSVYDSNFFMSWAHDSVCSHYESDIDAITLDTEISSFVDGAANENTNIARGHSFSASSHSTAENSTPTTSEVTCPVSHYSKDEIK